MGRPTRRAFLTASAAAAAARALAAGGKPVDKVKDVPWLADVQRPPASVPDGAPELLPLLRDSKGRPITTLAAWRARRAELRAAWRDLLGTLRCEPPEPRLEVLEEDRPEGVVRQLVRAETEPGLPVEGYLLRPARAEGRCSGVVALHSTVKHTIRQPAGVEGSPSKFFGLRLARRGVVSFCPKNFLWVGRGRYEEKVAAFQRRHPGATGMAKMLWDAQRAVDLLASLPEVDAARLGAVGHSLGGKEALYLAAFDERVRTAVSSEGGVGIPFSNWDAPWYLGPQARQPSFPRRHHELLALAAPRAFLLIGGQSADGARSWPYVAAALPVYRLYGGTPRLGLLNHGQGHRVPPEAERRIAEWFAAYL